MVELLALFERSPSPLDERALAAIAMERAPDQSPSAEDWSPVAPRLPDVLYGAVLERAQSSPRGGERAVLLEWLDQHGATRKELLTLTAETLRLEAIDQPVLDWLARSWVPRMLTTRTAWERHGVEVLLALIAHRAFTELGELLTLAWTGAGDAAKPARQGKAKRPKGPSQGYLEAIHLAFAQALVRLSSEALGAGKEARAMAALSALACLDPPSRVGRALLALRRAQGASGEVLELVALNDRLVKRAGARGASLEGLIAAVHALADALGGAD